MIIAFVSDAVFPWHIGGVEAMEYGIMKRLAKRHDVYCFCLQFPGMKKEFVRDGIHYICVLSASSFYTKDGKRSIGLAARFGGAVARYMKGYEFDMVYANAFPYFHLPPLKRYCRAKGSRLVVDVAEVWMLDEWKGYLGELKGRLGYMYMKHALLGADMYVAVSSTTASKLRSVGVDDSSIMIFAPVLDLSHLRRLSAGMRRKTGKNKLKTVLFNGRLIKEKGMDEWIEIVAAAHRLDGNVRGLMIGSGPESERVKSILKERGYGFIRFIPKFVSKGKLYSYIMDSSFLLQSSHREGLSIIVLESIALGTPVILPDYTPIPDEVKKMCTVLPVDKIPAFISDKGKVSASLDKRDLGALSGFSYESIPSFFSTMFKRLGLVSGRRMGKRG